METKLEQESSEEAKWVKLKKISSQLEFWIASHGSYKASHIISKLGKSGLYHFERFTNQSWNKNVMVDWSKLCKRDFLFQIHLEVHWEFEMDCCQTTSHFKSHPKFEMGSTISCSSLLHFKFCKPGPSPICNGP